jgi:hypothetical protein
MRLLESGFVNGYEGSAMKSTPKHRHKSPLSNTKIYCDTNGVWKFTATDAGAGRFLQAQRCDRHHLAQLVGTGSWTWTYHPNHFYTLPNRWMGH